MKGHWKMCPWGRFTVSAFQPSVCPKAWTQEVHVTSACFCVQTALWEVLSGSHLNFNLSGQNRKQSLPVYYLFSCAILQWWMRCHKYIIQGTRNATWLKTIWISAKVYIRVLWVCSDDKPLRMWKMLFPDILCFVCRSHQREFLLFSIKGGIPSVIMKCNTAVKP